MTFNSAGNKKRNLKERWRKNVVCLLVFLQSIILVSFLTVVLQVSTEAAGA